MVGQQCQVTTHMSLGYVREATHSRGTCTTLSRSIPSSKPRTSRQCRTMKLVTKASDKDFDIEAVIEKLTTKYEAAENKPVLIGYGVGGLLALLFSEYIIHLPGLDVLIGFPVQLVGVLAAPLLIVRYAVDKEDWYKDLEGTLDKVGGFLPGLKK